MIEIDFLPVGNSNGDAICIRYGDDQSGYYVHVVDGAFKETGKDIIGHIASNYHGAGTKITHMIVSHACNDHVPGLIDVVKAFHVGALWMNRPWEHAAEVIHHYPRYGSVASLEKRMRDLHPYLVELEAEAKLRKVDVKEIFQGQWVGPFLILAPNRRRYIDIIPHLAKTPDSSAAPTPSPFASLPTLYTGETQETWDYETLEENVETEPSNETCVVQLGIFDSHTALLTADAGPISLAEAASFAEAYGLLKPPNFIQVPHHGSRHNVTPYVLNRWLGQPQVQQQSPRRGTAFCSVGADADLYPRRKVSNAFLRRGYPVHATRGSSKTHFHGRELRNGWVVSQPEAFSPKVEE